MNMTDVFKETWFLQRGDEVVAVRDIDPQGAEVKPGTSGVVFEYTDGTLGPLVRWETGGVCNVYPGDVDIRAPFKGLRPSRQEVIAVFVDGDPDLATSVCECCEDKRKLLARLREHQLAK